MTDTLFADVSEFQTPVDDSYPYRILSIRSNDGAYYRDAHFEQNYAWATAAADAGKLDAIIVYSYWREDWAGTATLMQQMVEAAGGPHPKMIAMMDVESGGNPGGNQSWALNATFTQLSDWLGNSARVIAYANRYDFYSMWPDRPNGLRVIGAGYGVDPTLPGQIAHQYTDGLYGDDPVNGLPNGAPPFGRCDMNSADGLTPTEFAAACGVGEDAMPLTQQDIDSITNSVTASVTKWLSDFIVGFVGPVGCDVKDIREALTGSRNTVHNADGSVNVAESFPGIAQNGYRQLNDLVAALAARSGVTGAVDLNPTGAKAVSA